MPFRLCAVTLLLLLSGCAAFRNYDAELSSTLSRASSGNIDAAIESMAGRSKDLLYFLELGMLQRLGSHYQDSQRSWAAADEVFQAWQREAAAEARSMLGSAGSFVINDKVRAYEGHDYEKVWLLTYMALNYLAMGDFDHARVAIRQAHEREDVIADVRQRQLRELEEQAAKRGIETTVKELNGYPVQTIDNPEVNALKNSYQNALSHYLAGFIYEALGEPSLAAAGYRNAIELHPGAAVLEDALAGLDKRAAAPDDGLTDVLFIVGSGSAPALKSQQFHMPVNVAYRPVIVSVSFPVLAGMSGPPLPVEIALADGQRLLTTPIASIDLMSRRRLKDDMQAIMLRASIRSASRAALQYQLQRGADNRQAATAGALLFLAAAALSVATETADDRVWRSLPSDISIARARLPRGATTITLVAPGESRTTKLNLSTRYAVVDFRVLGQQVFAHVPPDPTREITNPPREAAR